jgi:hypothetical protein
VDLARALSLGTVGEEPVVMLLHLVILVAFAVTGIVAMFVMYRRELAK